MHFAISKVKDAVVAAKWPHHYSMECGLTLSNFSEVVPLEHTYRLVKHIAPTTSYCLDTQLKFIVTSTTIVPMRRELDTIINVMVNGKTLNHGQSLNRIYYGLLY